jgi:hypothetical protein
MNLYNEPPVSLTTYVCQLAHASASLSAIQPIAANTVGVFSLYCVYNNYGNELFGAANNLVKRNSVPRSSYILTDQSKIFGHSPANSQLDAPVMRHGCLGSPGHDVLYALERSPVLNSQVQAVRCDNWVIYLEPKSYTTNAARSSDSTSLGKGGKKVN